MQEIIKKYPFIGLTVLWVLAIVLVNPIGDFPLNDDFAYAQGVFESLKAQRLVLDDWMAMTLIGQIIWGGIFCTIFGSSYTVLRFSTLVMGFLALWATYNCLKLIGLPKRLILVGIVLLAFNPWFFSLSFTFMTDVPFFALFLWSSYYYLKALKEKNSWAIFWGTLFAIASIFIRQFGLLSPIVFAASYFLQEKSWRSVGIGILVTLIGFGSLYLGIQLLETIKDLPEAFGKPGFFLGRITDTTWLYNIPVRLGHLLFYWGWSLLPLLLFKKISMEKQFRFCSVLMLSVGLFLFYLSWPTLPVGNVFFNFGLGPQVLKDAYFSNQQTPYLPAVAWGIFKCFGFFAASLLLLSLVQAGLKNGRVLLQQMVSRQASVDGIQLFAGLGILLYTFFLLVDYYFWDRYLFIMLPFWLLLLTPSNIDEHTDKWKWKAGIGILSLYGLFAIGATHDYLSWNRVRWEALNRLMTEEQIAADVIDGGFEFNALYTGRVRNPIAVNGKSWWFVNDDQYVLTFDTISCYKIKDTLSYLTYLPPGNGRLHVLQRPSFTQYDSLYCGAEKRTQDGKRFESNNPEIFFGNGKQQDTMQVYAGSYAIRLGPEAPYGFSQIYENVEPCERFSVSVWRRSTNNQGGIVLSDPNAIFYEFQTEVALSNEQGWQFLHYEFTVPKHFPGESLQIYLWNPSNEAVWFDDFNLIRKKRS